MFSFFKKEKQVFKQNENQSKGFKNELLVKKFYLNKGYQLQAERKKHFGVEIDFIFKKENELLLVEVKTLSSQHPAMEVRWTSTQKKRFTKVLNAMAETSDQTVRGELAFVSHHGQIEVFPVEEF